jgi:hypothetical protein
LRRRREQHDEDETTRNEEKDEGNIPVEGLEMIPKKV